MSDSVRDQITERLQQGFEPEHLEVVNESYMHNVPKGSETHFRLVVVSDRFTGKNRVKRHQDIYVLLQDLISAPIHALSLKLYTNEEWVNMGKFDPSSSPPCLGGNKK